MLLHWKYNLKISTRMTQFLHAPPENLFFFISTKKATPFI